MPLRVLRPSASDTEQLVYVSIISPLLKYAMDYTFRLILFDVTGRHQFKY